MMSEKHLRITGALIIAVLITGMIFWWSVNREKTTHKIEEAKLDPVEMKKGRADYFFNLLRDPATNRIPDNIRSRELEHAKQVPGRGGRFLRKGQTAQQEPDISWQLAGPMELGGRTRALGIDQRNPDVILAGGVSGGVWKSDDGGDSWEMKTDPNQNMSVTSLAQDPSDPDTWYYASGEYRGNSASANGASYHGTGIYRSTDNGETWSLLSSTEDNDTSWNSQYDYISRIVVNPSNGDVYFSSNNYGIFRSTDGGNSFGRVFGGLQYGHRYIDITINSNGNILAALSENSDGGTQTNSPGIYQSTDDGDSWTDVTPPDFPASHDRTVLSFAPSAPDTAYVFTYEGTGSGSDEDVSFFMLDLGNDNSEDRSDNLPDFGGSVGFVNTQGNYNMVVSVKPDDPDFVMVGGTNLFRSRDGFKTKPSGGYDNSDSNQKDEYWVGGYAKANNVSQYSGQHPDQHVIAYNPDNSDEVWSGHDGGLSLTNDITVSSVSWQDKDEGYVTGQFYTVAIPANNGDDRFLGGTQDNGTPFFRYDDSSLDQTSLLDVSTGDGAYSFWGTDYAYVSTQNGKVVRLGIESDGSLTSPYDGSTSTDWSDIYPSNAQNQLFIHPYAIDPNDEGIMYYPGGNKMWRNTKVDDLSSGISGGTTTGWDPFEAVSSGYTITALQVTKSQPSNRLYYAAYGSSKPKIFSVDKASSSWNPVEISISGASSGAYVHDIAINPNNGDEVIAVMSNYNIVGLYHTADGGSSWTAIEGNLEGDSQNPGPSLRSATILPTSSGILYLVGTSTGVYSTTSLSGSNTDWTRESDDGSPGSIGYSIAEYIVSRPVDGKIAVGTHGRGIFVGQAGDGAKTTVVDFTRDIDDSWELIGSPMASSNDVDLGDDLTIFGFSGTYKSSSEVDPQNGYWVKSRSGSQINFNGYENLSAIISLEKGWNLIGGITETVSTSSISDPGGIVNTIYEYSDGSYSTPSDIKPTNGYWILADQSGDIELSSGGSSKNNITDNLQAANHLFFSSGNADQKFFIAKQEFNKVDRKKFKMPPQAPLPALDVRTTNGFRLAAGEATQLNITSEKYPVKVKLSEQAASSYALKGVTNQDTVIYKLSPGNEKTIQHPQDEWFLVNGSFGPFITEHDLLPNYPNPFNPTTNIEYNIASQTHVSLAVYDVLGRRVRTLVNEIQEPGRYTKTFDAQNLSSGTYFIRIQAQNFSRVQQMTLIK